MERKVALSLVVVHTGACQLKIIWNLIQENSEDNFEFSSAEKRAFNTHTHTHTHTRHYSFTVKKSKRFRFLTDLVTVELGFSILQSLSDIEQRKSINNFCLN